MVTAKHMFQNFVFNPANQKLVVFHDELQRLAKDAFKVAAYAIIEQLIFAKMPPQLKKSKIQTTYGNGTYEQIVTHLERELEPIGLEAPAERQLNTVSQYANKNSNKLELKRYHCEKNQDFTKNKSCQLKEQKIKLREKKVSKRQQCTNKV